MKKKILIAYHEAGHVVACHLLHRSYREVNIIKTDNQLGVVMTSRVDLREAIYEKNDKIRNKIEKEVIIDLAGFIAEKKYSNKARVKFLTSDHDHALRLLSSQCESNEEIRAYLNLLWIRTKNLFDRDYNWKTVIAIADTLLIKQRLSYQKCRRIINKVSKKDFHDK